MAYDRDRLAAAARAAAELAAAQSRAALAVREAVLDTHSLDGARHQLTAPWQLPFDDDLLPWALELLDRLAAEQRTRDGKP